MKEHNIYRLIEASPFTDNLPSEVIDALASYIDDCGYTLDNINIDDIVVNALYHEDIETFNKDYDRDDVSILHETNEEIWFFN